MNFAELKSKNPTELKAMLAEEKTRLFKMRQQSRTNVLKQNHLIALARKTIARIMVLLSSSR
jgi:ribosomal protein L29